MRPVGVPERLDGFPLGAHLLLFVHKFPLMKIFNERSDSFDPCAVVAVRGAETLEDRKSR